MEFQFSPDKQYLYIKHDTGLIEAIPFDQLTEANKQYIWEKVGKERL